MEIFGQIVIDALHNSDRQRKFNNSCSRDCKHHRSGCEALKCLLEALQNTKSKNVFQRNFQSKKKLRFPQYKKITQPDPEVGLVGIKPGRSSRRSSRREKAEAPARPEQRIRRGRPDEPPPSKPRPCTPRQPHRRRRRSGWKPRTCRRPSGVNFARRWLVRTALGRAGAAAVHRDRRQEDRRDVLPGRGPRVPPRDDRFTARIEDLLLPVVHARTSSRSSEAPDCQR